MIFQEPSGHFSPYSQSHFGIQQVEMIAAGLDLDDSVAAERCESLFE